MDSPCIHPSAPRGSIIFGFFVQLKNAYLCKGQQHQLLYCIMAVKMKADLRLFSGVGRICFSSGWKQNNETYICPYPWGSKFNSSSAAGGVLDSGMSGQNLVLLHEALEQALGRERGDWKGSLGSPVVLQAEKWNCDFTVKVISQAVSEAQGVSLFSPFLSCPGCSWGMHPPGAMEQRGGWACSSMAERGIKSHNCVSFLPASLPSSRNN